MLPLCSLDDVAWREPGLFAFITMCIPPSPDAAELGCALLPEVLAGLGQVCCVYIICGHRPVLTRCASSFGSCWNQQRQPATPPCLCCTVSAGLGTCQPQLSILPLPLPSVLSLCIRLAACRRSWAVRSAPAQQSTVLWRCTLHTRCSCPLPCRYGGRSRCSRPAAAGQLAATCRLTCSPTRCHPHTPRCQTTPPPPTTPPRPPPPHPRRPSIPPQPLTKPQPKARSRSQATSLLSALWISSTAAKRMRLQGQGGLLQSRITRGPRT